MKITISNNVKQDVDKFIGRPTIIKYKITDIENETYETEIHMPINWNLKELPLAITKTFFMCDNKPTEVFIMAIDFDNTTLN